VTLEEWAARWKIPPAAFAELVACSIVEPDPDALVGDKSEAFVQSRVRLEAARAIPACFLWRNNVGASKLSNGSFVRWGLANDSRQLNQRLKSGDLIGLRSIIVSDDMVGTRIGQFVSRECKRENWKYSGTREENAQLAWATLIKSLGGDAQIVKAPGSL
jgi:hypothetical protein